MAKNQKYHESVGGSGSKAQSEQVHPTDAITAPLRDATFRRIWTASLFSNLGWLMQGVAAAWAMSQMTSSADMVALVQTAFGFPVMLMSLLAGAMADIHDRRKVALVSLSIAAVGGIALTVTAFMQLLTPSLLLTLCFVVGCGIALMGPAWQSSVSEQVRPHALPAAVALNGISFNIARSVGPAIGGVIVATLGTNVAFAVSTLAYLPLMAALFVWNRVIERSKLPPESLSQAMVSGVRYIVHSPVMKIVLIRSLVLGSTGGAILALMPLVASELLHSGAATFGILSSAFGIGAVLGALSTAGVRRRMSAEAALRACSLAIGGSVGLVALSSYLAVSLASLVVAGAAWVMAWTLLNVGVQRSVPRWVVGRSLAAYQAAATGGIALGSWGWGHLTNAVGVQSALLTSAALMAASLLVGLRLRMPEIIEQSEVGQLLEDPVSKLSLAGRDGPLVVELEYRVAAENACDFCDLMQEVQLFRQRNGAYDWSLARDIADPTLWIERYRCSTWFDYLRQRNRSTHIERAIEERAMAFHRGADRVRVRRMLEGRVDVAR